MCGDLVRYSKAERRMMLGPLAGLWRRWLRDRLRSRRNEGGHVHGRRLSQIRTRLPPVGRQGSDRGAATTIPEFGHDWTQAALGLEGVPVPSEPDKEGLNQVTRG